MLRSWPCWPRPQAPTRGRRPGPPPTQTINACLDRDGQLRLVAIADACKKNETPLSWNTVGPTGPPGADGKTGAAGKDGRDGQPGPPGSAAPNPDAVSGTVAIVAQKQGAIGPIELKGVSHEIISPRDVSTGQSSGKRMHKPFVITKELDKSTPLLLSALVDNENLTSVLIGLLRPGQAQAFATIKLTNASLAGYATHGLTETWSFTYQKITWTYLDGGITAEDSWLVPAVR